MAEAEALLAWLQTFPTTQGLEEEEEGATDVFFEGVALTQALSEVDAVYFDAGAALSAREDGGDLNWMIASNNVKKLLTQMQAFYHEVLSKDFAALNELLATCDVEALVRERDVDTMLQIVRMVVGAAVLCEDNGTYIQRIMELPVEAQAVLKGVIEEIMGSVHDMDATAAGAGAGAGVGNGDGASAGAGVGAGASAGAGAGAEGADDEEEPFSAGTTAEELYRAQGMIEHLQEEKQTLVNRIDELEQLHTSVKGERDELARRLTIVEQEKQVQDEDGASRIEELVRETTELRDALTQSRKDGVENASSVERLRQELAMATSRSEDAVRERDNFEAQVSSLLDELDLYKSRAEQLGEAEVAIEKYKAKLEEMTSLRKQLQDYEDKTSKYMEQIVELESTAHTIPTLNRMLEQHKDKAVELERQKLEAVSACAIKDREISELREQIANEKGARATLKEELEKMRRDQQLSAAVGGVPLGGIGVGAAGGAAAAGMGGMAAEMGDAELRSKIERLEAENRVLRQGASEPAGEVQMLRGELDDLRRVKEEQDKMVTAANLRVHELQSELDHVRQESAQQAQTAAASASNTELETRAHDLASRLDTSEHANNLLEERLKRKETQVNKLTRDKEKLEMYAKRTLQTFTEKYMAALSKLKDENKKYARRVEQLENKLESSMETYRREERLLLSAVYELGSSVMDMNIQRDITDHPSVAGGGGGGSGAGGAAGGAGGGAGGGGGVAAQESTTTLQTLRQDRARQQGL